MAFIGIDPGVKGAIAIWRPGEQHVHVSDMPTKTNKSGKRIVDEHAALKLFQLHGTDAVFAVVEQSQVMPGQAGQSMGTVSSFNYGVGYGKLLGILAASGVEFMEVPASVWKRIMGLTRNKNQSREVALRLFEGSEDIFGRKKDDGRAEAALLAYLAEQVYNKRNQ